MKKKIPKNFSFYCPEYLRFEANNLAEKLGVSTSALLQNIIRDYCKKHSKNPKFKEALKREEAQAILKAEHNFSDMRTKLIKILKD